VRGQRHAPAALYPWERPGTHCAGGWVGPRAGLDRCGKSFPLLRFDPRTVCPVASRYTDYATRPYAVLLTGELLRASMVWNWDFFQPDLSWAYLVRISEDGCSHCLRNVGTFLPGCTVSSPSRQEYPTTLIPAESWGEAGRQLQRSVLVYWSPPIGVVVEPRWEGLQFRFSRAVPCKADTCLLYCCLSPCNWVASCI